MHATQWNYTFCALQSRSRYSIHFNLSLFAENNKQNCSWRLTDDVLSVSIWLCVCVYCVCIRLCGEAEVWKFRLTENRTHHRIHQRFLIRKMNNTDGAYTRGHILKRCCMQRIVLTVCWILTCAKDNRLIALRAHTQPMRQTKTERMSKYRIVNCMHGTYTTSFNILDSWEFSLFIFIFFQTVIFLFVSLLWLLFSFFLSTTICCRCCCKFSFSFRIDNVEFLIFLVRVSRPIYIWYSKVYCSCVHRQSQYSTFVNSCVASVCCRTRSLTVFCCFRCLPFSLTETILELFVNSLSLEFYGRQSHTNINKWEEGFHHHCRRQFIIITH